MGDEAMEVVEIDLGEYPSTHLPITSSSTLTSLISSLGLTILPNHLNQQVFYYFLTLNLKCVVVF